MDTNFAILKRAEKSGLICSGDRVTVGISGGVDSAVLLDALVRLRDGYRLKLYVVHVNYRLRGRESDRDERFVKALARKCGIKCFIKRVNCSRPIYRADLLPDKSGNCGSGGHGNLQNTARDLRYEFCLKTARKLKANKIAVAHNADDQAETLLLHLIRGSGLKGLGGMEPSREIAKGITLIRPLLSTTRDEIVKYVKERSLKFVVDRTNRTKKYSRNVIRHDILPLLKKHNPNIIGHLCKTAAILRDEDAALNEFCHPRGSGRGSHARNRVPEIPDYYLGDDSKVTLSRSHFLKHHIAIRRRLLRLAYARLTGGTADLLTDHIDKMLHIISSSAKEGRYSLPRGVRFVRKGNVIIVRARSETE
jgi:tRNA(Ile)-lysidine synthase